MEAIPLLFPTPNGHNNGSGFLVFAAGRHWLATAAHLAHLLKQPHKNWQAWPQFVQVSGVEIPLFHQLSPRFAYLDAGATIADLLMLPLPQPLPGYTIFDTALVVLPTGEQVTAFGYVRLGSTLSNQLTVEGTILGIKGELVLSSAIPPEGFSGGPLVTSGGRLVGLNIGVEEGVGVSVGLGPIARAVACFQGP
jgi:hypothetical protein